MRKITFSFLICCCFLLVTGLCSAQTPGLIYESATGGGAAILDPNSDGYTSTTTAGFIGDDQTDSEVPYVSCIIPSTEPNSDLDNGPDCGYTDFVDQGDKDPAQKYLSAGGNWLFRLRLGGTSPAAKSYSVLIDTDGKFGNSGADADPDFSIYNPGFEIEIVMATKFGVYVYDVNAPNCTAVISYPGTTNYQKSIAMSTDCGDADYFLDFYVVFADLVAQFGITSSTSMFFAIISNTSSNSSTMCSPSSASDITGYGSFVNLGNALSAIIEGQGPCAPDGTGCLYRSDCPPISSPITEGATTVSGTSTEADGTDIDLYNNGVLIGSTTVSSGTWSIAGLAPLVAEDELTATATAAGEYASATSCNEVIVSTATCTAKVSSVTVCNSNKSIQGIATAGAAIRFYDGDGNLLNPTGGTTWNVGTSTITATTLPSALSPTTDNFLWKCNSAGASTSCAAGGGPCIVDGSYYVTAQSAGECESDPLWFCNGLSSTTATPTISTSITTATTSVSGTVPAPDNAVAVTVYLYTNNVLVGSVSTSNGAWTINSLTFDPCDEVTAMAVRTAATQKCASAYSSVQNVVIGVTDPPVILDDYCTTTSIATVSGISTEEDGTVIQVYDDGAPVGSTTTVSGGAWSVTGLTISSGHTITATALGDCKTISAASTGVLVSGQTTVVSLAFTTSPIIEESTVVSGTYASNGAQVQLYIDDSPIGSPATVAGGVWTVNDLETYDLFVGGAVTATVTEPGGCESTTLSGGSVDCISASTSLTITPTDTTVQNGGVATIEVLASETRIIYQLYLADEVTSTGSSVRGTGGSIFLVSDALVAAATLKVKAIKLPATVCPAFLTSTVNLAITLPIELLYFNGQKKSVSNELQWVTASEKNNDFFTLEKSTDGLNYSILGLQKGAGNSISNLHYEMADRERELTVNYYRLKQTDFDGKFSYSSPISIDNRETSKEISSIVNMLGVEVNELYRGLVIVYYSDGSMQKVIQ